jgi:hypothetical protein
MQLRLRPKTRRGFPLNKYVMKVILIVSVILACIFLLGKLELPAPTKLIKQEISNDKLIKLK